MMVLTRKMRWRRFDFVALELFNIFYISVFVRHLVQALTVDSLIVSKAAMTLVCFYKVAAIQFSFTIVPNSFHVYSKVAQHLSLLCSKP